MQNSYMHNAGLPSGSCLLTLLHLFTASQTMFKLLDNCSATLDVNEFLEFHTDDSPQRSAIYTIVRQTGQGKTSAQLHAALSSSSCTSKIIAP